MSRTNKSLPVRHALGEKGTNVGNEGRQIFGVLQEADGGNASHSRGKTIASVIERNTAYRKDRNRYGTTSFGEPLEALWSAE